MYMFVICKFLCVIFGIKCNIKDVQCQKRNKFHFCSFEKYNSRALFLYSSEELARKICRPLWRKNGNIRGKNEIEISGQPLEQVDSFMHLGSIFSCNGRMDG